MRPPSCWRGRYGSNFDWRTSAFGDGDCPDLPPYLLCFGFGQGATVVCACRDLQKAQQAADAINAYVSVGSWVA